MTRILGAFTYSEPGVLNRNGKLGDRRLPREESAHIPKSNRMPEPLHSVKAVPGWVDWPALRLGGRRDRLSYLFHGAEVETQVVYGI